MRVSFLLILDSNGDVTICEFVTPVCDLLLDCLCGKFEGEKFNVNLTSAPGSL